MRWMNSPDYETETLQPDTVQSEESAPETGAAGSPMMTGLWVIGAVFLYYVLQMWLLPPRGFKRDFQVRARSSSRNQLRNSEWTLANKGGVEKRRSG